MNVDEIVAEMPKADNPYSRALERRFKELKESPFGLTKECTYADFIKGIITVGSPLNPIGSKRSTERAWVDSEATRKEAIQDQCQLLAEAGYRKVA